MTEEDEKHFNETDICWLCEGEIISRAPYSCNSDFCFDRCGRCKDHEEDERIREEYEKVRDHDHLTGKYRGPAHNKCNLNCRKEKQMFVPVYFHNFSGYDCHLFFEQF